MIILAKLNYTKRVIFFLVIIIKSILKLNKT